LEPTWIVFRKTTVNSISLSSPLINEPETEFDIDRSNPVTSGDGGEYFFSSYGWSPQGSGLSMRSDLFKEKLYLSEGFGPNSTNPMAYNGRDDLMRLARESRLDSKTKSLWFALQSEFLDGRLRTLLRLAL
jgi:hypothetical protein